MFQLRTKTLARPRFPLNVVVVVTPFTVLLIVTVEPLLLDVTETEVETEPETDAAVALAVPMSRMVRAVMDKYRILSSHLFVCRLRRLTVFPPPNKAASTVINTVVDSSRSLFSFRSVTDLRHRKPINQVDPNRLTGKTFSRCKTFPESSDDYIIIIDGLEAGRIMRKRLSFQQVVWFWTMTAPYYPAKTPHNGEEDTYEAAREAFKKTFWEWHAWALERPGKATWYGAKE